MPYHQQDHSFGSYHYDPAIYTNTRFRLHFHKDLEILYVVSGSCVLSSVTGEKKLQAGELFLIPPFVVHKISIDANSVLWLSVFSSDFIANFANQHANIHYSQFRCDPSIEAFLQENFFNTQIPNRYKTKACLYLICDQLLKHATPEVVLDYERISAISYFVSQHLFEDISLQMVADALNLEYHYFSRLFHKLFCMNFRDYVKLFRIEKARTMLAETKRDIAHIAWDCGFESVRSFNRSFKAHMGITPSQFRAQQKISLNQ